MKISLKKELSGSILDIGGGGEGIIGRIYGKGVIAIDNHQEELDEAPESAQKVLMDATKLLFPDESFDHVTSFYTLMYMQKEEQVLALREAARVLRKDGQLHIWDAVIRVAYPEPYLAELEIDAAGELIHTTYGIVKPDAGQDAAQFISICRSSGFDLLASEENEGFFHLRFKKL